MANLSQISTNRGESVMHTFPLSDTPTLDFAETQSVTLEWKLSGLKHIYEGTRGETKSKCIKSAVFGDPDNLWEIILQPTVHPATRIASRRPQFYIEHRLTCSPLPDDRFFFLAGPTGPNPNSGTAPVPGEMSSFYLSAVPTKEEQASGIKGKWVRKGVWAFRFDVRVGGKGGQSIAYKEAATHTVNWGWQSFAKRSTLYYNAPTAVRETDSFVITCTVSANSGPPAGAWLGYNITPSTWQMDPDVAAFTYAPKGFEASGSGWRGSEGAWKGVGGGNGAMAGERMVVPKELVDAVARTFDREVYSDVEFVLPDRKRRRVVSEGHSEAVNTRSYVSTDAGASTLSTSPSAPFTLPGNTLGEATPPAEPRDDQQQRQQQQQRRDGSNTIWANKEFLRRSEYFESMLEGGFSETAGASPPIQDLHVDDEELPGDSDMEEECLSDDDQDDDETTTRLTPASRKLHQPGSTGVGPTKTRIVIRDAAFRTWYALIYYLYTDVIVFAPLASSFINKPDNATSSAASTTRSRQVADQTDNQILKGIKGRREWLETWITEMEVRTEGMQEPVPCSAKAIYRLADKLDLPRLRQRAFQHIISQLTVQNCPFEVFTNFSATYEQVRKVEIAFFLHHWNEIKDSNAMVNLWQQIRLGRFDAFTEIWPHIVSNLSFVPSAPSTDQ